MKNLLIGSLLAAVAVFLWGFVFWAVLAELNTVDSDAELALQSALAQHVPETGTYVLPQMRDDEAEYTLRHETGPTAMIFVQKEGSAPMSPSTFGLGLLHEFIFALLIGALLRMTWASLPSYGGRVGFVILAGVAAAFWSELGDPIWWAHPWGFHVMNLLYAVGAWAITGLIMARFAAPREVRFEVPARAPATAA